MPSHVHVRVRPSTGLPAARAVAFLLASVLALSLLAVSLPAAAGAAVTTFGSPLAVPATLNTTDNLDYGTTGHAPAGEAPDGAARTASHIGADTAIWNTSAGARAPQAGQALKVRLEGCAEPANGGPAPLTQMHLQDLSPIGGGGAKVNLTSQPFNIPVCGKNGASGSTITTYQPTNLCMSQGDYLAFNDEGGYVPGYYPDGVPYEVLGAAPGSSVDSFVGESGNGAVLRASATSSDQGFAATPNEELMLQVVFGTGADAAKACGGGGGGSQPRFAPVKIGSQTDGVNHARMVRVAVYCHQASGCKGVATLEYAGKKISTGTAGFSLAGGQTGHIPLHITAKIFARLHKHKSGIRATLVVVVSGQTFRKQVDVKIF